MKKYFLYKRDSKGKVRLLIVTVAVEMLSADDEIFTISRETGLLNGKLTKQPDKIISKGKSKRTVREQALLETKSLISKQRDDGYKLYQEIFPEYLDDSSVGPDPMDYKVIDAAFSKVKTDANGNQKPILAKDTNVLKQNDVKKGTDTFGLLLDRAWWGSPKFDGIRTKAKVENNRLAFLSKSGKAFQGVTTHFAEDQELIDFCNKYNCEIDGEFYCHGVPLKDINGHCQKREYIPERHDQIKFYLFGMALHGMDAADRCKILNELQISNPRVIVVKHKYLVGRKECLAFQDECVEQGYEGAMLLDPIGPYEFGKRSNYLWKLKPFMDAEGIVLGISEGLREEDMCFIMETEDGVEFRASIIGNREEKQEYRKNINSLIGKQGTYKFQYYTPDGKPFLPKFKCFRNDEE